MNENGYTNFAEEVFNIIDQAKIDEQKEVRFKVSIVSDIVKVLSEIIRHSKDDMSLNDYEDTDFKVSEIVYNYEDNKIYVDFEDEA
jgi:hypothetical protein